MNKIKRTSLIIGSIILVIVFLIICKTSKVYIIFEDNKPHCVWINRKWEEPYYNREAGTYTYYMEKEGEQYACEKGSDGNNIIFKSNELLGDSQAKITNLTRIRDRQEYLFVYDNCIYKYGAENNELTKLVDMGDKEDSATCRSTYKYIDDSIIDYIDYNSDTMINSSGYGRIKRVNFRNDTHEYIVKSAGYSFDEGENYIYVMGLSFFEGLSKINIWREEFDGDLKEIANLNGRMETAIYYDADNHRFYFTDKIAGIINLVKCYDEVNDRITTKYVTLKSIQGISSR